MTADGCSGVVSAAQHGYHKAMQQGGGGSNAVGESGFGRRQFLATSASLAVVSGLVTAGSPAAGDDGVSPGPAQPLEPGWVIRDGWVLPVSDL